MWADQVPECKNEGEKIIYRGVHENHAKFSGVL
jgi:hypothetical protein